MKSVWKEENINETEKIASVITKRKLRGSFRMQGNDRRDKHGNSQVDQYGRQRIDNEIMKNQEFLKIKLAQIELK